ncbi:hypothetical protein KUV26_20495 [Leisingera daeponensis]|uniref:Uncharacterized protein n=1 Tax=Leisingera daeponensis TaxID=405746 RepID=A0ABS7NKW9_9RHOB|nr:hypothetical protein [Leisingera daeponensis]MBY6141824.1 hypothetical protein [Leisingera daeponensis]
MLERLVFTLLSGAQNDAVAAILLLRARAAKKSKVQVGLLPQIRRTGREWLFSEIETVYLVRLGPAVRRDEPDFCPCGICMRRKCSLASHGSGCEAAIAGIAVIEKTVMPKADRHSNARPPETRL